MNSYGEVTFSHIWKMRILGFLSAWSTGEIFDSKNLKSLRRSNYYGYMEKGNFRKCNNRIVATRLIKIDAEYLAKAANFYEKENNI